MSVSRAACKDITRDIEEAIAAVLVKHDLKVESVRSTYGESYSVKISADSINAPSTFVKYAHWFDLDPALDGRTFVSGSFTFRITGIAPKSRVRPVLATRADGKTFKFPIAMVKAALA